MNKMQIERLRTRLNNIRNQKVAAKFPGDELLTPDDLTKQMHILFGKCSKAELVALAQAAFYVPNHGCYFKRLERGDNIATNYMPDSVKQMLSDEAARAKAFTEHRDEYRNTLNRRIEEIVDTMIFEKSPNVAQILSDFEKE